MKNKISIFLVAFLMLFNVYQIDYNTKKIEINKPVEAIEPLTAYFISSAIAGLALSLGYQLVNSTSDSFTQGCMTLYNNFTTNTKNLIDRIAGKKQAGDSTYDVTPDELESFGNELTSSIESGLSGSGSLTYTLPSINFVDTKNPYEIITVNVPDISLSNLWHSNNLSVGDEYKFRIILNDVITHDYLFKRYSYNYIGTVYPDAYKVFSITKNTNVEVGNSGWPSSDNMTIQYLEDGGKPTLFISFGATSAFGYQYTNKIPADFDTSMIKIELGYNLESEPPVINVGQMNISELISALQASGALNSQGAVTQQFITNYDTAVPADIYTDINAKTAVDTLYDGADTNVPDVPQDWTILQSMYQVLRDLYQNVRTGINTISNTLSNILTNVKAIPQTIATTITSLFVPPEGFMTPLITDFQNSMSAKFGDRTIDLTQFSSTRIPEDIEITIMGQTVKVFESQPLIDFVEAVRAWIIGFIGILAMIYNFNNVYRLFAGAEYVGSTGSSQLNSQGMLQGNNDSGFLKLGGGK